MSCRLLDESINMPLPSEWPMFYLFICGVFNAAASISDCMELNGMKITE
jgi:hypothetical protein